MFKKVMTFFTSLSLLMPPTFFLSSCEKLFDNDGFGYYDQNLNWIETDYGDYNIDFFAIPYWWIYVIKDDFPDEKTFFEQSNNQLFLDLFGAAAKRYYQTDLSQYKYFINSRFIITNEKMIDSDYLDKIENDDNYGPGDYIFVNFPNIDLDKFTIYQSFFVQEMYIKKSKNGHISNNEYDNNFYWWSELLGKNESNNSEAAKPFLFNWYEVASTINGITNYKEG